MKMKCSKGTQGLGNSNLEIESPEQREWNKESPSNMNELGSKNLNQIAPITEYPKSKLGK